MTVNNTDAEELEELRFYKRLGFPYFDHSNGFKGMEKILAEWDGKSYDDSASGYWAITLPASIPHPGSEGTVSGRVLHAYTLELLYAKAKAHMADLEKTNVVKSEPPPPPSGVL